MQIRNTSRSYGTAAIVLHWLVAVTVIGLAILGLWMTDLTYYSPYYRSAPFWHKSIGVSLALLIVLRLLWRWANPKPAHIPGHKPWELRLASLVHGLLYLLLIVIVLSGYLISTAKGQGIDVFGWFTLPALITGLPEQADRAGLVHYWLAISVLVLAGLHALGALKHHFIDRDNTLRRMLGLRQHSPEEH
ncbi:cytochrome b [Halopseudomonas laoshanensis]|uniref:Cytochrome b n=1 Tax=Halopseudomonas laoshanensis TaxID=2268758 RepID=A0A7V7GUN9_9GAMM|nr:cytochrome b [Halopseudomonas laoshanensis]KAA0695216.1 cytochrome b [Halopseudomonas laoshanensis]WOD11856.1 cytochrome b [Pseudomonas sp. NyZ704]